MGSSKGIAVRGMVVLWLGTVLGGLGCEAREPLGDGPSGPAVASTTPQPGGSSTISTDGAGGSVGAASGAGDSGTGTGGAGDAGTAQTTAPNDSAAIRQELMDRWNRVAEAVPSDFDFSWQTFDQFPHPTYKGGSEQAYQVFAVILLNFFDADGNGAFLSANHLFTLRLRYIFPSGQSGLDTSFAELAATFSSDTAFGNIPAATRAGLKAVSAQINSMM